MPSKAEWLFPETDRYVHRHCWYIIDIPYVQCFDAFATAQQNYVRVLYSIDEMVSCLLV